MDEEAGRQMIRELWLRYRPVAIERLDVVGLALGQLAEGRLQPADRDEARSAAHKLLGILGTYGFADASVVAGEAEAMLDLDTDPGGASALVARLAEWSRRFREDD